MIMMHFGNMAGNFLLPMVVCKAQSYDREWTLGGGSPGTVYDATQLSSFDAQCLHAGYIVQTVSHIKDQQGVKLRIGNNFCIALYTSSS